jgi:hypothetical protein
MQQTKQASNNSNKKYGGAFYVRMDTETEAALRDVVKLSERNKSDAIRWCIRQMKSNLAAGTKSAMKSTGT